jgi:hypothetical protein
MIGFCIGVGPSSWLILQSERVAKSLAGKHSLLHALSAAVMIVNPYTPNDLRRCRAVSPLKINIPSKNIREKLQIHQLFVQFINCIW